MMCHRCGADNPETAAICILCGNHLEEAKEEDPVLTAFANYIAWPVIIASIVFLAVAIVVIVFF